MYLYFYVLIRHNFFCHPKESTVSEEVRTESKPVAEFPLTVQAASHSAGPPRRVSDPHWFHADLDSTFFLIADTDLQIKVSSVNLIVTFLGNFLWNFFSLSLIPVILRACQNNNIFSWGKMSKRTFLQIQKNLQNSRLKVDPDPAPQINADSIRIGSTIWKRIRIQQLKLMGILSGLDPHFESGSGSSSSN